jgi:hypothetical protein
MVFFSLVLCFSGWQVFAADQGTSGELSSIEPSTTGPTWVQGPLEGTAIVAVRTGSAAGAGHVGVAFYNPSTGKWIAAAVEGYNSAGYIAQGDKNGGWYKEFNTKEEVINEFFSDTSPDASTDYPGHAAYDKIKIITVEKSYPGSASNKFVGIEDSGYLLTQNDCLGLTNDVLRAYGVQDLPSGMSPLDSPQSDPTLLDLQKAIIPNLYYYDLKGDTEISRPSQDAQVDQSFGDKSDLGGINFTSIKLNSIAVSTDQDGGVNFDLILKAQKATGTSPGINLINSTTLGLTAFNTGLAVPDDKFWVNLNPWEPDRIIDEQLWQSEVGRIMLEADLQMKKDLSNYGNPCSNETGKALWKLLHEKQDTLIQRCMMMFPGEIKDINNIWFSPVMSSWIVPDKVYAYTNAHRTQIYIINATLTIQGELITEQTHFKVKDQDRGTLSKGCLEELNKSAEEYGQYNYELIDRMILPYVIADVNRGEKYEDLRDIFIALALAQWYKLSIPPRMDIFRDRLESSSFAVSKSMRLWSPKEIWDELVNSYYNHEYICWVNTTNNSSPTTWGGVIFKGIVGHMIVIVGMPPEVVNAGIKLSNYSGIKLSSST